MVFHSGTYLMNPRSLAINLRKLSSNSFLDTLANLSINLSSHSQQIDILRSGRFKGGFFESPDILLSRTHFSFSKRKWQMTRSGPGKRTFQEMKFWDLLNCSFLIHISSVSWVFSNKPKVHQWVALKPIGGLLSCLLADLLIENKIEAKIKANRKWKKSFNWVRLIGSWIGTTLRRNWMNFPTVSILCILP